MNDQEKYKVVVNCMTYNQSAYIVDTMNGFCMQQTDFPYVCCITDDASTDGEQDVIRHYISEHFDLSNHEFSFEKETESANIFFARHKKNTNCFFAIILLKFNHYSIKKDKYIYIKQWSTKANYRAMCEGDDYWINPQKLQIQVDFLDNNPDFGLVYTNYGLKNEETGEFIPNVYNTSTNTKILDFKTHLRRRGYIAPPTWLYRRSVFESLDFLLDVQDTTFCVALDFFGSSKVECIDEVTAVYRVHNGSASNGINSISTIVDRNYGLLRTQLHYSAKYRIKYESEEEYIRDRRNFYKWFVDNFYALTIASGRKDILKEVNNQLIEYKLFNIKIVVLYIVQHFPFSRRLLIKKYASVGYY